MCDQKIFSPHSIYENKDKYQPHERRLFVINTKLSKLTKWEMYGRQKNSYGSDVSRRVNTKLTIYYKCILTAECVEQLKNVETKSWKVSLRRRQPPSVNVTYITLPGSQHSMPFCEKENQKDSCGPRIWQALDIVNVSDVYAPAIAKCLQENLSTSD